MSLRANGDTRGIGVTRREPGSLSAEISATCVAIRTSHLMDSSDARSFRREVMATTSGWARTQNFTSRPKNRTVRSTDSRTVFISAGEDRHHPVQ